MDDKKVVLVKMKIGKGDKVTVRAQQGPIAVASEDFISGDLGFLNYKDIYPVLGKNKEFTFLPGLKKIDKEMESDDIRKTKKRKQVKRDKKTSKKNKGTT